MRVERCFWLYLLECDNGAFYTGYTKNLAIRYHQHKSGKQSAKYTRIYKPIKIAQCWRLFDTIGTALKVERFIKNQDRKIKLLLVENPEDLKSRVPMQAMDGPPSLPISANNHGLKLNIASSDRNQNLSPDAAESKTPIFEKRANLSHS